MIDTYDSTQDTLDHISKVKGYLDKCIINLENRARIHDLSKLESPEKEAFDVMTPKLKISTYGSPEYKEMLKELGVALDHHYQHNSHHPEHFKNNVCTICFKRFKQSEPINRCNNCGNRTFYEECDVSQMSLFDILEMLMDWKAASERHENGDIIKSIEHNKERFGISDQLTNILLATVKEMVW
jgi:hypothetical protein